MIVVDRRLAAAYRAEGWWHDLRLTDLLDRHVREAPEVEALVDPQDRSALVGGEPRRLTWVEVGLAVDRTAATLNGLGLGKDDVILTQLPNVVEYPILYLAAWRLGIIVTPLPVQHREKEIAFCANRTGAKALVTVPTIGGRDHLALMRSARPQCSSVVHILSFGAGEGAVDLTAASDAVTADDLVEAKRAAGAARVTADDVTTICWTSGTEADPKGVPRSHNEWRGVATFLTSAAELQPGARLLTPFPLVNISGVGSGITVWLELGGAMVLHHPFDLDLFLKQLREERIDYTTTAPAILTRLLEQPERLEGIDFGRLSRIGSGSAPLSEWLVSTWLDRYGVELINTYGSNEGAGLVATRRDVPDPAERGVFFPRFGDPRFRWTHLMGDRIRNRLIDPDTGREIDEPGVTGELRVKGPTVFTEYWNAPELTAAAFDDEGWYRTGDLFEIAGDRGQYYRFVGRLKDIVLRGGMNISCEEIEGYLTAHPTVLEAAVVGAPDEALGERVCACVVPAPGAAPTLAGLVAFLRDEWRIAVYKQPERLELFDALPRNPVGKVLKRELREAVRQRME
ncbi:class I adenylate-forming enzyme family protein [Brevundimonas staleyi]|uniref:Class I adenylate-forming enzyme family protein n=1 Tax=Brevundimonas staleyi TaxID=74326 RepID=A0ABW0FNN0_9CAUL